MKGKCVVCGRKFQPNTITQITCSPECHDLRHRETSRLYSLKRYAEDSEFRDKKKRREAQRTRERFAVDPEFREMRRKYVRKYAAKKRAERAQKANCLVCGKEFIKRYSAKTCGKECGKRLSRRRVLERRLADPEKFREKYRNQARQRKQADPEKYLEGRRRLKALYRAAGTLGVPPIVYAAMKLGDLFTQTQENPSAQDRGTGA